LKVFSAIEQDRSFVASVQDTHEEARDVHLNMPVQPRHPNSTFNLPTTLPISVFSSIAIVGQAEVQQEIAHRTDAIKEILSDSIAALLPGQLGNRGILLLYSFSENSNGETLTDAIKDLETAINLIDQQSPLDPRLAIVVLAPCNSSFCPYPAICVIWRTQYATTEGRWYSSLIQMARMHPGAAVTLRLHYKPVLSISAMSRI
jgi:hypothetical protein